MSRISNIISWAYFWKQKDVHAVQVIAWISLVAMLFSSAAMITLFSIYNGLEGTVKKMYQSFYSDIEITSNQGKFYKIDPDQRLKIDHLSKTYQLHEVLEDLVLMTYGNHQKPVQLKGVSQEWMLDHKIDEYLFSGVVDFSSSKAYMPIVPGLGVANDLKLDVFTFMSVPTLFYLEEGANLHSMQMLDLPEHPSRVIGTFSVQDDFDQNIVLAPIDHVRDIFAQPEGTISALEIDGIDNKRWIRKLKKELQLALGDEFVVKDRYEQNQTLYWIMQSEKWAIYAILALVMIIASFNMIGSIAMLILEKKEDIFILRSLGISEPQLFSSFFKLGLIITFFGAVGGLILGGLICLGQYYFGWISFPDGFVVQAFPVAFEWVDFVVVFATCMFIGGMAALLPSRIILKDSNESSLRMRR